MSVVNQLKAAVCILAVDFTVVFLYGPSFRVYRAAQGNWILTDNNK